MDNSNVSVLPATVEHFQPVVEDAEIIEEIIVEQVCPLLQEVFVKFHLCHPWAMDIEKKDAVSPEPPKKELEEVVNHTEVDLLQLISPGLLLGISPSPLLGCVKWLEWIGGWVCICSLLIL